MNRKIIIQIPFNIQGFDKDNELDNDWIKYRLDIFVKYCLGSLRNQTNQYFTVILRVWDSTFTFIKDELRGRIPDNLIITSTDNYYMVVKNLIEQYDYLYAVRMDSDDCYDKNFVDLLQSYCPKPETEILINQNCYSHDICSFRLAYYFYIFLPSKVWIYKKDDYKEEKWGELWTDFKYCLNRKENKIISRKYELFKGINYLSTIHQRNNSGRIFEDYRKTVENWREIKDKDDIKKVLSQFGITEREESRNENKG